MRTQLFSSTSLRSTLAAALVASSLLFVSCGPVVPQDGIGGDTGGLKPTDDDLKGTPGSFNGTWSGPCTYVTSTKTITDCQMTFTIDQNPNMITATVTYTLSGAQRFHALKPYVIKGNQLQSTSGGQGGMIGSGGFVFFDDDLAQVSGRLTGGHTLGVLGTRLPLTSQSTSKGTGFSASLQLTN